MWKGDYSRKKALVDYGFRLPSAFDNRPLRYDEFDKKISNVLYVSATPSDYELKASQHVAEQIVRPTGLVDPQVLCKPKTNQMADLLEEIQATLLKKYRVLVTTLTKRMAENLSEYLAKQGVKVRYLHSEIETLERNEIIRQLRLGTFDVLVGINLLREGLDIPEVALVAILDADKEGFLRDARSLIQTCGRAARNVDGRVILYADTTTGSMQRAMEEMSRRRTIQLAYNTEHGITPQTIIKPIREQTTKVRDVKHIPQANRDALIEELTVQMNEASESLDFERAIDLRDQIHALRAP
jgi:excinuclease ABC subunit B